MLKLVALVTLGTLGLAHAQTPRVVALAPLSTLGTEDTSASSRKMCTSGDRLSHKTGTAG